MSSSLKREEVILYVLSKESPLTHNQILQKCKECKDSGLVTGIFTSARSYYLAYDTFSNQGFIERAPARINKRTYLGYAITPKGKRLIAPKLNQSQAERVATLNAISGEEMGTLVDLFNDFMGDLEIAPELYDLVYDGGLILASQLDRDYFISLYKATIPELRTRKKMFYKVVLYIVIHATSQIKWVLGNDQIFPLHLQKFRKFCTNQGLDYFKAADTRKQILQALGAIKLRVPNQTWSNQSWSLLFGGSSVPGVFRPDAPLISVYILGNSLEKSIIKAKISEKVAKLFVHAALGEKIVGIRELIDDFYDEIAALKVFPPEFTGRGEAGIPTLNPDSTQNEDPAQIKRFKSLLGEILKDEIHGLLLRQEQGLLEIPPVLLAEIGEFQPEVLRQTFGEDISVRVRAAREKMGRKEWTQAIPLLKELFKETLSAALHEIYNDLITCYKALGNYEKIRPLFKLFWKEEWPSPAEFSELTEVLVDLREFEEINSIITKVAPHTSYFARKLQLNKIYDWFGMVLKEDLSIWIPDFFSEIIPILLEGLLAQGRESEILAASKEIELYGIEKTIILLKYHIQTRSIEEVFELLKKIPPPIDSVSGERQIRFFALRLEVYAIFYPSAKETIIELLQKDLFLYFLKRDRERIDARQFPSYLQRLALDFHEDPRSTPIIIALAKLLIAMDERSIAKSIITNFWRDPTCLPLRPSERQELMHLSQELK